MGSWTTRQWLVAGVSVALAVLLGLLSLGVWSLSRSEDITGRLVDIHSPALIEAERMEAALLNQETGVRGYSVAGQQEFLAPWEQGLSDQETSAKRLSSLVRHDARAVADLAAVETAAGTWQRRYARPVVESPAPEAAAGVSAAEGKKLFDAVRAASDAQQDHLQDVRSAARDALDRAAFLRNLVLGAIAALVGLLALVAFEGVRRGITEPLARLRAQARTVAAGRFDQPVDTAGPADLRALGADVEAMRRRLVDELEAAEASRRLLDEQTADLQRSNAELEQFAYVASHDLQEPLRKVSSFTQLLQRRYGGQLDDRADQYIGFAVDGANRMQTLINDLLDFSRVGRVHNQQNTVDLDALADRVLESLSVTVEETGAVVTRDPLPTVIGDSTQLGMLLQNLVSNAIKFRSQDTPPRIRIEAERDGAWWRLAVSDNGIGIAPEFAEKIFVIFQRLHTKDAYPGNGIGLAMCKKVVEFHGGVIALDPGHHPGSRFTFTLPVHSPEPAGDPDGTDGTDGADGTAGRGEATP
nr:ATP-binding protein [Streptomyces sp. t39]